MLPRGPVRAVPRGRRLDPRPQDRRNAGRVRGHRLHRVPVRDVHPLPGDHDLARRASCRGRARPSSRRCRAGSGPARRGSAAATPASWPGRPPRPAGRRSAAGARPASRSLTRTGSIARTVAWTQRPATVWSSPLKRLAVAVTLKETNGAKLLAAQHSRSHTHGQPLKPRILAHHARSPGTARTSAGTAPHARAGIGTGRPLRPLTQLRRPKFTYRSALSGGGVGRSAVR